MIPSSFIPAVEKGVREAMEAGVLAGLSREGRARAAVRRPVPLRRLLRDRLQARRPAGDEAGARAAPTRCCWSRSCSSRCRCPRRASATSSATSTAAAGARRAWSRSATMTEIRAEVPMAEMLTYAPDLRSITQGQGDYTLEFLRYEEVPAHLAQKVVEHAGEERRQRTPEPAARRRAVALHGAARQLPWWADGHAHDRHLAARRRLRRLRAAAAARRAARRASSPPGGAASCASCARRAPRTRAGCARATAEPLTLPPMRPRRGRSLLERLPVPFRMRQSTRSRCDAEPAQAAQHACSEAPAAGADGPARRAASRSPRRRRTLGRAGAPRPASRRRRTPDGARAASATTGTRTSSAGRATSYVRERSRCSTPASSRAASPASRARSARRA